MRAVSRSTDFVSYAWGISPSSEWPAVDTYGLMLTLATFIAQGNTYQRDCNKRKDHSVSLTETQPCPTSIDSTDRGSCLSGRELRDGLGHCLVMINLGDFSER
jgi:hypothetical protein